MTTVPVDRVRWPAGCGLSDPQIAAELGVSPVSVANVRAAFRVPSGRSPGRKAHRRRVDRGRCADLAAAGLPAARIAAAVGCSRAFVHHLSFIGAITLRARPPVGSGVAERSAGCDPRTADAGPSLGDVAGRQSQADPTAGRSSRVGPALGLPDWFTPRQVRIVCALAAGPLGKRALAAAVGVRTFEGLRTGTQGVHRNAVPELLARGYVARLPGPRDARGRRTPDRFVNTLKTLDALAAGGRP